MVKSPRPRAVRKRSQSPDGYHPFKTEHPDANNGCGLHFLTGQIEYGESYFANGLVFDGGAPQPSPKPKQLPLAALNMIRDRAGHKPKNRKRLSGDRAGLGLAGDENQPPGEGSSPQKKQKCAPGRPAGLTGAAVEPPAPRQPTAAVERPDDCPLCLEKGELARWRAPGSGAVCRPSGSPPQPEDDTKCPSCLYVDGPSQPAEQPSHMPLALSLGLDANAKSFTPSKKRQEPAKVDELASESMQLFYLSKTSVPQEMMGAPARASRRPTGGAGRIRVIQRNLMYVTNIPPAMADQRKLAAERFGEFGEVARLVIRTIPASKPGQSPVISAYVTYEHEQSTALAISQLNGKHVEGKRLRASYGSNKYCNAFIRGEQCTNPRCSYLHQLSGTHECFWEKSGHCGAVQGKKQKGGQRKLTN